MFQCEDCDRWFDADEDTDCRSGDWGWQCGGCWSKEFDAAAATYRRYPSAIPPQEYGADAVAQYLALKGEA